MRLRGGSEALDHAVRHVSTTRAVERVEFPEARRESPFDRLAQKLSGAVQPRLHRFRADREVASRFLDAHPLDVAKDEDYAEHLRQTVDGLLQHHPHAAPAGFGL